ncbi:Uncharacterized protein APZ42_007871 [Daphnia magna]|uniref:Uncharacterized protein n=1 Tax=Daphnia magna TaxID=35525 RepID=A0A0P5NI98_9CRUS|nr:Uncharacterized protein APZ42_007871 [Daphnia magna]
MTLCFEKSCTYLQFLKENFDALFLSRDYIDPQRSNARGIPHRPATYYPATHPSTECIKEESN